MKHRMARNWVGFGPITVEIAHLLCNPCPHYEQRPSVTDSCSSAGLRIRGCAEHP